MRDANTVRAMPSPFSTFSESLYGGEGRWRLGLQGLPAVPIGPHISCRYRHALTGSGADATNGWTGRILVRADAALHAMALFGMR